MKKKTEKILFRGKWLTVLETAFENREGKEIFWESIVRPANKVGVVIIPVMRPSNRYVLIKQFRPALNGYVLGFPAGLAQGDPSHALVELEEETGYFGEIKNVSPVLKSNSGVMNDSGMVVLIEIDENDSRNLTPRQKLEDAEDIEVLLVPESGVYDLMMAEQETGTHIGGNLWYLFGLPRFMKK